MLLSKNKDNILFKQLENFLYLFSFEIAIFLIDQYKYSKFRHSLKNKISGMDHY